MKTWVKIVIWFCTGTGIGFFAGYRVGQNKAYKEIDAMMAEEDDECESVEEARANEALHQYRGDISSVEGINYAGPCDPRPVETDMDGDELASVPEEDPEMPMDIPTIDDEEPHVVPQLHPTQLLPKIVSEDEYYRNPWEFEEEKLVYYELDEVVYNSTTQSIVEYPDNVLGVGTLYEFHIPPNEPPKEVIFVINEIFGTRFRIDRIDAAFCDEVDGNVHPEDDPPEAEDDDYWNDI